VHPDIQVGLRRLDRSIDRLAQGHLIEPRQQPRVPPATLPCYHPAVMPSESEPRPRRIIHVDMDAFFASVEQRDNPELRGLPVAVGSGRERGVVAAASYEARAFGVHSAMASVTARRKCPDLIFVPPRFDVYRAVSQQIHGIFACYTPLIQPLSLDEAHLDVTAPLRDPGSATAIATEIKARIREQTGLTASAGVSYNKFLAKLASGYRKPDGLFVITPRMGPAFVETLPVSKFHGIGPATAARMRELGIHTGADLRGQTQAFLTAHFGKAGDYYYAAARGEDDRPVVADRQRKSLGVESTFPRDLLAWDDVPPAISPLVAKLWVACTRTQLMGRTVTAKVKYDDFQQITRSRSAATAVTSQALLEQISLDLLRPIFPPPRGVRLLGITLSNFDDASDPSARQLALTLT
jgi:DNA polymerase IV